MAALEHFSGDDLSRFGEAIRGFARQAGTMERSAQLITRFLWEELRADGTTPDCALVRLYKTHPFGKLPPDLREFAEAATGGDLLPETRCLTLLATRGLEQAWNDRRTSEGHRAIPLPSVESVRRLPMVAGLIDQLGLDLADVVSPAKQRVAELAQKAYDVFHVEDVRGSPYVPAQDFVERYGIRSALGFGGVLFTGDFFATVLFSRVAISAAVADRVRVLSLATRVALMPFGTHAFDD
jgi:hypothetical protein